jgi:hypothetical protein
VSLRSTGPHACVAEFDGGPELGGVTTEFRVTVRDGIATATPTPDIFQGTFDGTAEELRSIVAAVTAFCRVSTE